MRKVNLLTAAVSAALLSTSALAVDFNGYMRAGVGVSGQGQQVQFAKDNLGRLGNENDVYGEIGIGKDVWEQDGVKFRVNSMLAVAADGSNDYEALGGDNPDEIALRQFNVEATGVLGFAPEATVWAGKRYNQRHDIHITDRYYWDISGAGAGIDHIEMGPGKLSVMWVRSDRSEVTDIGSSSKDQESLNVNIFDVRYGGLELWKNSSLELGVDYAMTNESDAYNGKSLKDGVMLTAELTQSIFNGFNKTVVQYGTEGYGKAIAYGGAGNWYGAEAESGASAYRLINHGVMTFGQFDISHQLLWQASLDDIEATQTDDIETLSLVVRPQYRWNELHTTILELGAFTGQNADGSDNGGQKYTVAQAISAGDSFWARPELRVYASYIKNDEGFVGNAANQSDSEVNFGVQVEAWW
ncbi:maltoporin [Vibrio breoganii]|uniref:maltoporin n=1 Tax=Vibrio breoganii TaxID=553239 RepID=UPI000C865933|nr:maltoporin [Vibrio breoganii]PMG05491.1 maltoporin [Vibrio breoganii]